MGGLDKNIFVYNDDDLDLYRELLKSDREVHSFDSSFAMYLKRQLGCSSSSSSDDGDGDSSSSDSDSSSSSDSDDNGNSSSSDSDDVDTSGGGGGGDGENEEEDKDEDEDEGQADTHMKMFLQKLAADGTSYVLKRDGKPDLKFEGMEEYDDEFCNFNENEENFVDRVELSSDCESGPRRRRGTDLDVRSGATRDKGILRAYGMGNSRNVNENEQIERRAKGVKNVGTKQIFEANEKDSLVEEVDVIPGKRGGKTVRNMQCGKDSIVDYVDLSPVKRRERDIKNAEKKQTFMDNKKYRLVEEVDLTQVKRRGKNGKNVEFVENESDSSVKEVDSRLGGTRFSRNIKEIRKLERIVKNVERQNNFMEYERNNSVEDVDLRPDGRRFLQNVKENGELERRAKNVKYVEKENSFKENERDSSMEEVSLRSKKLGKVSYKKKRCLSKNISALEFDPEYKMFFDQCEIEGDSLFLVANGKRLKYGEDDNRSLSDSEVYVLDRAPDCIESNYTPTLNYNAHMEEDDLQCLGSCNVTENPQFRKEVMEVLRMPFNYKEYKRLWEDVKLRKPTERHVDMRSGNTSFQQPTMGKSYLDHYTDLKKQLKAFEDDTPKMLNILRGFFFYLKRMADDGKFKPWLDESCLAIIPRTG